MRADVLTGTKERSRDTHLQPCAPHREPARRYERPTHGHVAIDGQQNGDPDGTALHHVAERVDVLDEVRRAGRLDVEPADDRQQSVDDRQLDERDGQHEIVGGRQRLQEEHGDAVSTVALQDEQRHGVSEQSEDTEETDQQRVDDKSKPDAVVHVASSHVANGNGNVGDVGADVVRRHPG